MVPVRANGGELRNSMTAALLAYVRRARGEEAVVLLLEEAGERRPLAELEDRTGWSSHAATLRLFESAAVLFDDPHIGREVGAEVYLRERPREVIERLRALGRPADVVRYVAETADRQSAITEMSCIASGIRWALVSARTVAPFERHAIFCDYISGMLAAVPTMFDVGLADVTEVECQALGASRCLYLVSWETASSDAADAEIDLLRGRLDALTKSFEELEAMATELVSVGDSDAVLQAVVDRAGLAVRAGRFLLAVRLPYAPATRVHAVGFTRDDALEHARRLVSDGLDATADECLVVGVASSNHAFGRLAAFDPVAGRFLPEERRLLEAYAGHAAAVLESTAALEDARERAETMTALFRLATELSEVASVHDVARRLAVALHTVVDCDLAAVLVVEPETRLLACVGRSSRVPGGPPSYRRLAGSVAGAEALLRLFASCPEPIELEVATSDAVLAEILRVTGTGDGLLVPIVARGECFGALALGFSGVDVAGPGLSDQDWLGSGRREGGWRAQLAERLAGVVGLVATALHNSRLIDEIRHQSLHDPLTGLPNRVLVLDRVDQALARSVAQEPDHRVGVLLFDLDGFKDINETFGHGSGDELLQEVARRLEGVVDPSTTVARLGGDEFVVVLEGAAVAIDETASRLLAAVRMPFTLALDNPVELSVTASIGIAMGPSSSAGELLRDADVALYGAKAGGRDRAVTFAPAMHAAVQSRLELEIDLRAALTERQFFLVFQPTFDLRSGRASGAEALIRWQHPTRGIVGPDAFVPVLEETGLVVDVGRWVLEEACRQAQDWRSRGHQLAVAVNVSARQLEDRDLVDDVARTLRASGLDPLALTLELTETVLARDPSATSTRLAELRDLGVRIAIDDFGTGYSSLSYLRQFPVDALKIDRSFVSGLGASEEAQALVRTLVRLGRDLGLEVIAEGIEEESQLALLRFAGCDTGQGYLLARPLTPGALDGFLAASSLPLLPAGCVVPANPNDSGARTGALVSSGCARAEAAGRGVHELS